MARRTLVRTAVSLLLLSIVTAALVYAARQAGGLVAHPILAVRLMRSEAPSQLPVPVKGVRRRELVNSWGSPRSGGRGHRGIDIFAPRGREIVSATRGIVMRVGHNQLGGRVVWIFGPGGQSHYYAHLERFAAIRSGDVVEAGTVIGYVGDSGNARGTPPHLHYGIYELHGGAINPYPLLNPR